MFNCFLNAKTRAKARMQAHAQTEAEILQAISTEDMTTMINQSSYYYKHCPSLEISSLSRHQLEQLYAQARNYACSSIVNALYRVDRLKPEVNHVSCKRTKFHILARTRTNWEVDSMEETADRRNFLSFSVLNHRNLSHFPGRVLYGYRSNLKPSMIAHISHIDASTFADATNRLELTEELEELLDVDDLSESALVNKTYCQVTIRSKYTDGSGMLHTFLPDCIICIGKPDRTSQEVSHLTGLPILMIHPAEDTICHVHDFYATPSLANPHIL